jgi:2-dehydro-3-deoxyphosphogluconate aldolase / (4S)-4-hydroxy-2-oxoglutarate aldolase
VSQASVGDFFGERLARAPVLAILRGEPPGRAALAAERCWEAGIELVEVSISRDERLAALRAVCERARTLGGVAGAGTVCTAEEVHAVVAAGAAFAVAPGLSRSAVEAARSVGLPYLPGVATPSEVQAALELGLQTLKLFPAGELGHGWIRAMAAPFPQVRFVAVGGVSAANADEFIDAGVIGVGLGSGLVDADLPALLARLGRCRA